MLKNSKTGHEVNEDEHEDYKDMLEECKNHAIANKYPEEHVDMIDGMSRDLNGYETSEEADEQDEEDMKARNDNEGDEREKKDSNKGGVKLENSEVKKSNEDIDAIETYLTSRKK